MTSLSSTYARSDSHHATKKPEGQQKAYNDWPNDLGFETVFEQREEVELTVEGKLPAYVAGTLYRTGPGRYKVDTTKGTTYAVGHWFDGFNKVHRFDIGTTDDPDRPMRVRYNSRSTVDKNIEEIRETGKLDSYTFARQREPCDSYFKKVKTLFTGFQKPKEIPEPSAANIGVTFSVNMPGLSDQPLKADHESTTSKRRIHTLHTKTDANAFQQLDPRTLEPLGLCNQEKLHPELKGPFSGAHARSDPVTGDVFNYNLELGKIGTYRVFTVSASTGKTTILATIQGPSCYIHSHFLTEDYVILCGWNSHYALYGLSLLWNRNILDSISPLDPSLPAKWYVVDRRHGKGLVAVYETPAFFAFHTVNAYQETSSTEPGKTDIVADVTAYDSLDVLHRYYYDNLLSSSTHNTAYCGERGDNTRGNLRRYRLPGVPSTPTSNILKGSIDWAAPQNLSPELPTMNPSFVTRPYRYCYGALDRGLSSFVDGIVKFDNKSQTGIVWSKHGHSPGEAIFVADPDGKDEDDGVLLSVVLDGAGGKSYLLCLDAKDLSELGRAHVGGAIGFGFHGCHFPEGRSAVGDS